jgi:PAS domain S-box-containing protein
MEADIRYWSEECYRVLGFDSLDGLPSFDAFFQRIYTDDQAAFAELIDKAIREKSDWEADYRIVHPDGKVRDIRAIGHPILRQTRDLIEFVGTVMDVTERKLAERERTGTCLAALRIFMPLRFSPPWRGRLWSGLSLHSGA